MSDYAELVGRLKQGASISRSRNLNLDYAKVADEAADAIKALVQEMDALKRVHDDIMQAIDECGSYKP